MKALRTKMHQNCWEFVAPKRISIVLSFLPFPWRVCAFLQFDIRIVKFFVSVTNQSVWQEGEGEDEEKDCSIATVVCRYFISFSIFSFKLQNFVAFEVLTLDLNVALRIQDQSWLSFGEVFRRFKSLLK